MLVFNYKPEIKHVLSSMFKPANIDDAMVEFLSLEDLIVNLTRVIPKEHVNETDVYEVLKELGFTISQDQDNQFGFMVQHVI